VTLKACVGLNGMKLGGKYLTVVRATPDIDVSKVNVIRFCFVLLNRSVINKSENICFCLCVLRTFTCVFWQHTHDFHNYNFKINLHKRFVHT
jgi:hypothetical protein